jgi:hypothetical protein
MMRATGSSTISPRQFRTYGPDGQPETGGPRIPLIVISPFAVTHGVSHVYSEHSSVIRFVEELKGLVPLGDLPDEAAAFTTGANLCTTPPTYSGATPAPTLVLPGAQSTTTTINPFCLPNGNPQTALGPADVYAGMGDLTEAFDNDRLLGNVAAAAGELCDFDPNSNCRKTAALQCKSVPAPTRHSTSCRRTTPTGYSSAAVRSDRYANSRAGGRSAACGLQSASDGEQRQSVLQHQQ